ncbi:response regulator transcription factor [Leucobacter weissii]|uniref:Response regulator transcription factor n=1 Tax=Leucobacter weissii TaxID=1983706 RepID=A0A939MN93_9MICO|nr:response regulator transcription factor [Leucobacter weissii]MBO1901937.1 response regulator transcription factor [Leucobacter weissii]
MSGPIRVLLTDDQPLFTSGLRLVIDAWPGLRCVGEVADGAEVMPALAAETADVLLLDLRMPRLNGLQVLRRMPPETGTRTIVLTTIRDRRALLEALRLGASSYLTKDARPEVLLDTIRRVHEGETAVGSADLLELLETEQDRHRLAEPVLPGLTPREREVFLLCARGLSNAEIAAELTVAEATAKSQLRSVMQKLGLRSRVQVAIHAYEHGIARPAVRADRG